MLLYHAGMRVRIKDTGQQAVVRYTVQIGVPYRCPHCDRRLVLSYTSDFHFGVYLTQPHPAGCCVPWQQGQLTNSPMLIDCSLEQMLSTLGDSNEPK